MHELAEAMLEWVQQHPRPMAAAALGLVCVLAIIWRRSSRGMGAEGLKRSKAQRRQPKKKAVPTPSRRHRLLWALGAVAAAAAAMAVRRWRVVDEASLPLSERCAHRRFSYRGLGSPLRTDDRIAEGALCCYYGGRDFPDAQAAMAAKGPRQAHLPRTNNALLCICRAATSQHLRWQASPSGGVRVAHLPPLDACGVGQLAMDAHRIELAHPTRLSEALRAVREYEKAAVRDNSVKQVATEPFAYYATRTLKPGDEVTAAFGASYWLTALRQHEKRPATRLLLCLVQAEYQHMMRDREATASCATLQDATGETIEFVFSSKAQALVLRSGAPLTEMMAGGFIVRSLRVGVKSEAFWGGIAEVQPEDSALQRLQKLVRHLVKDGLTTEAVSEYDE